MAYNREWDQGKDNWNDPSWNDYQAKGNVRGREDDYFGEGKRRKFNNGGYDASQGWDEGSSNNYPQGRANAQWQQQEHTDDRQHWNAHPKKRQVPSEPSPHVIFLGLDPDFTEADLQAYLTNQNRSVETVTIIRDRSTGASKGFGFAQFASIELARAFVDPNFPFIQVPPPASHGASATQAFYKALETGLPHNGRRVKIDYSQSASPADRRRGPHNMNDGTRDIGNTQAPVLLFRGLDPLSGPQAIAQAMKNSSGLGKEGAKGMKRIVLIKDKVTLASWGFAFVEFVDVQSSSAVLGATMSPQIHPAGFRISDKPVAASFAHPYSFQPLPDYSLRDDACIMGSLQMGGVEGQWVRYWDEGSTIAQLEFKVEEPTPTLTAAPAAKDKEKKKKAKGDADPSVGQKPAEASTLPVSDKPVTLSFKGGLGPKVGLAAHPTGPVKRPLSLGFGEEEAGAEGNDDDDGGEQSLTQDPKVAIFKKVAPMVASKKTAKNITKWNQVQEELKDDGSNTVTSPAAPVVETPPAAPVMVQLKSKSATPAPAPVESEFEYSDLVAMTCLLCARQFKTQDQLKRHNKESDLHKRNHKDSNLRDVAREKAKAAKAKHDQPKYRDRAAERRVMHNQPDIPMPESSADPASRKRHAEGPPPPPSPPPPPVAPGQDENNVGNKLLRMMGWQAGTGLGTDGEGRVEPVQTAIYAQGVGLGASKGKEIGKYADGYTGYVHMAQDAARERYNT